MNVSFRKYIVSYYYRLRIVLRENRFPENCCGIMTALTLCKNRYRLRIHYSERPNLLIPNRTEPYRTELKLPKPNRTYTELQIFFEMCIFKLVREYATYLVVKMDDG